MAGVVIDVKIFSRIERPVVEKDRGERIGEVRRIENDEKARISTVMYDELRHLLAGQDVALMLKAGTVEEFLPAGSKTHGGRAPGPPTWATSISRRCGCRIRPRTSGSAGRSTWRPASAPRWKREGGRSDPTRSSPAGRVAAGRHSAREGVYRREAEDLGG